MHECRSWKSLDINEFRADLESFCLCDNLPAADCDLASPQQHDAIVEQYNMTLTAILDCHAPIKVLTFR